MTQYYAMISPGRGSDWGELILIDSRVSYFVEKVTTYFDDDELEELRGDFKDETWYFLKEQFKAEDKDDREFVEYVEDNYNSIMSDNYYVFSQLNSTLKFNSVAEVIKYVQQHKIQVVGDLT